MTADFDTSGHGDSNPLRPRYPNMSDIYSQYDDVEKLIDDEKFAEAAEALEKIVAQDDTFVLAHLALARVYTKTGQHAEAIAHGEKACELEPTDPFNFTALSVTYQRAWAGTQEQQYITKAEDAMARARQVQQS
jgi:tetratricopeptide (TPR) repeat protein